MEAFIQGNFLIINQENCYWIQVKLKKIVAERQTRKEKRMI